MNEKNIGDILASSSGSESHCNGSGDSNKNLTQRHVIFACELSAERINSCCDHISESCSSESEDSSKYLTLLGESSPCTFLSDEQINSSSKCSANVANHRTSEDDTCTQVTPIRVTCHESPNRRATSRGPNHRATSRGSNHRATSRGLGVQHYTPVRPVVPYYEVVYVPYYQAESVPYYQAESVPYYQAESVPYYQAESVPYYQAESVPYYQAESLSYYQAESVPYYPTVSVPRYQELSVPCCRSSSGPCCRSSTDPHYLTAGSFISYQAIAIPSYQTASVPEYRVGTFQRPRGTSLSRPRACPRPESKINLRRGVITFRRRRRGRHPVRRGQCAVGSSRVTKTVVDRQAVAGSSQNQVHKNHFQLPDEEPEESLFSRHQFRSGVSRSNNEEVDFAGFERNRNHNSQISDSNSCNYAQFPNSKREKSNISDFSDSKNEVKRNSKPSESNNGRIRNSEISDGKSSNGSNHDTSIKETNSEETKIGIYTDIDPEVLESLPQQASRFSRETSDSSFQMLSMCTDESLRKLNQLIRLLQSVFHDDDSTFSDVSESLCNDDSECENFASNASKRGLVDSFLESRNVATEREFSKECSQDQSIESITLDKYELEKHSHIASPIRLVVELCINVGLQCKRFAANANVKLSKNTEFTSDEESRIHLASIREKMQNLESIIKQFRKCCGEYYDEIKKIFANSFTNSHLQEYWEFWIKQLEKSLELLDELLDLCLMKQA